MLITRRSDYAVRICRALRDGNIHNVKEICEMEDIPKAFAYKILREMEGADLVKSERGNRGGYYLNKPLDDMTVYDVVSVTESDLSILKSMLGDGAERDDELPVKVQDEMDRIQNVLLDELKSRSIEEILEQDI